jgi:hypothetical protein
MSFTVRSWKSRNANDQTWLVEKGNSLTLENTYKYMPPENRLVFEYWLGEGNDYSVWSLRKS